MIWKEITTEVLNFLIPEENFPIIFVEETLLSLAASYFIDFWKQYPIFSRYTEKKQSNHLENASGEFAWISERLKRPPPAVCVMA